jgi:hypothetical protein
VVLNLLENLNLSIVSANGILNDLLVLIGVTKSFATAGEQSEHVDVGTLGGQITNGLFCWNELVVVLGKVESVGHHDLVTFKNQAVR